MYFYLFFFFSLLFTLFISDSLNTISCIHFFLFSHFFPILLFSNFINISFSLKVVCSWASSPPIHSLSLVTRLGKDEREKLANKERNSSSTTPNPISLGSLSPLTQRSTPSDTSTTFIQFRYPLSLLRYSIISEEWKHK